VDAPDSTAAGTETATETRTETATDESTDTEQTHEHRGTESVEFARNPEELHPTVVDETSVSDDEV